MAENERTEIRPQAKQEEFLSSSCDVAIFGGSNFSGKSYALLLEPLRHIGNPKFGAVFFRRTYPEIMGEGGLWEVSQQIYPFQGGQDHFTRLAWSFRSGARVRFTHLQRDSDLKNYDGWQIPLLLIDQLESFSENAFFYLLSRNRTDCGIRAYCRASCNPAPDSWLLRFLRWWIGDDGFPIEDRSGVIRYYVRRNNEITWADTASELSEDPGKVKSCTFIPGLPDDNPIGLELNPGYLADLEALPYHLMMQRRYGNWHAKPEAGKVIDKGWFGILDESEVNIAGAEACLYFDFAATEKEVTGPRKRKDPDYTSCTLMLKLQQRKVGDYMAPSRFLVAHCYAEQLAPADVDAQLVTQAFQWRSWCLNRGIDNYKVRWEEEPGSAGKRESQRYIAMLAGIDAMGVRSIRDKLTRALPFVVQAKAKNVDVLQGDWNDMYLDHLHNYPELAHDDIWDSNSGAFNGLTADDPIGDGVREQAAEPTPSRWTTGPRTGSRFRNRF